MVRGDGYYAARWRQNAARVRAGRRRADALLSRLGPGAADPDDCAPARLDPVAAASMGRADCLFIHKETGALHPRTLELFEAVAERIEQHGIRAWHALDPRELIGNDAEQYVKSRDTLDVWFDSG